MRTPTTSRSTALFTKRPRPGAVKTRLCPPLLPEQAARLAEAMLLDLAERLAGASELGPELRFAPAEEAGWFAQHLGVFERREPQRGEGLAERLRSHFEQRCAYGPAVVVGSDCPLLPIEGVERAHALLDEGVDLVLGPDLGGGYYLIGLRSAVPELFTEVPMSTDDMCARTEALARARGLRVERLAALFDVDVEADLRRLQAALAATPSGRNHPARTAALLPSLLGAAPPTAPLS